MNVLITGDKGWIGTALRIFLYSRVGPVYGIDLLHHGDINDLTTLYRTMDKVDLVYHLAGETGVGRSWFDPYPYYLNNTLGSAKVFRVARELGKKVIYASTGEVNVGNSPYAASKIGAEAAMQSELIKGADIVALRILNPYGVGQPDTYIIPKFLKLAMKNEPITIHGTGDQRKDYIYITDIVTAFYEARKLPAGTIADLGVGRTKSIKEIAQDVIKITDSKSKIEFVPSPRPGELDILTAHLEALKSIGWSPQIVWEEGLNYVREDLLKG